MNSKLLFVLFLGIASLAVFRLTTRTQKTADANTQTSNSDQNDSNVSFESQSTRMGAVDVEITPNKLEPGKIAIFDVAFNTHSVELEYDFTTIMTLTDNNDTTYKTTEWVGGSGGHHLSGAIGFEKLNENIDSLTLKIDGIDNQATTLTWQL